MTTAGVGEATMIDVAATTTVDVEAVTMTVGATTTAAEEAMVAEVVVAMVAEAMVPPPRIPVLTSARATAPAVTHAATRTTPVLCGNAARPALATTFPKETAPAATPVATPTNPVAVLTTKLLVLAAALVFSFRRASATAETCVASAMKATVAAMEEGLEAEAETVLAPDLVRETETKPFRSIPCIQLSFFLNGCLPGSSYSCKATVRIPGEAEAAVPVGGGGSVDRKYSVVRQ